MDSGFNLHRCIELRLIWVRMINVALKGILLKQSGNNIRGVWETGPWESEDEFSKPINMECIQKAWCWILLVSLAMNKQVFVVVLFCFYYFFSAVFYIMSCIPKTAVSARYTKSLIVWRLSNPHMGKVTVEAERKHAKAREWKRKEHMNVKYFPL